MDQIGYSLAGAVVLVAILRSLSIGEYGLASILSPVAAALLWYGLIY